MASRARIKPPSQTQAERDKISLGRIEAYLDGIAQGHMECPTCKNDYEIKEVNPAIIQALRLRYDKLRPTLSAVEQTNVEPEKALSEADLLAKMGELIAAYPDLAQRAIGEYARKQHDAKQQSAESAVASTPQVISK